MTALLAFDTATEHTFSALEVDGRVWQHEGEGGAKASASFLPALQDLIAAAGSSLQALDAIAFGRGPGAFTGLRVACSVAQGLALAASLPVIPIDTLLAIAEDARAAATARRDRPGAPMRIWAVLDARMNEIYAAEYRHEDGEWTVLQAPRLMTPEALNQRWRDDAPELVAGNALSAFEDQLVTGRAERMPGAMPRGDALLRLAHPLWRAGAGLDAAQALPLYVRDKVADTSAERAARVAS